MKVAICLSGESFDYISIYHWLKENFYSKYDCETYIHTWDNSGNIDQILKLYEPKNHYSQSLIPFDDNDLDLNNILNEAYSTHACYNLVRDSKQEYDFIIHIKFNTFPTFNKTNYDKFAVCSPSVSEHYADYFSFILYYTFVDESYKNLPKESDNELQNLIKYHLDKQNLSLDTIHTFFE